ncbi:hypothetical protein VE04_05379 [Pseudogymnoascus sp. 24MN13]|nr:hypothetical protein VE04_05379 [Pseudogymnoascus sp. 24MN13]
MYHKREKIRQNGGKSLPYMLPAILSSSGTVIVVVPYVELLDHLVARATKQGWLDCGGWRYNDMDRASHQLVLVSADFAVTELFIEYAGQLKSLKHVFFNEAHCDYVSRPADQALATAPSQCPSDVSDQ